MKSKSDQPVTEATDQIYIQEVACSLHRRWVSGHPGMCCPHSYSAMSDPGLPVQFKRKVNPSQCDCVLLACDHGCPAAVSRWENHHKQGWSDSVWHALLKRKTNCRKSN
ncbi:uncharacterized protein LOC144370325 [Ictidomys tridecemlineatus]